MRIKIEHGNVVFDRNSKGRIRSYISRATNNDAGAKRLITRIVIALLLMMLFMLSVFALRHNNLAMDKIRAELIQADRSGSIEQVESIAKKLQQYANSHMNADTGKVALQTLYDRAAETALASSRPAQVDRTLYNQAAEACRPQLTNYGYEAWASCTALKVGVNQTASVLTAEQVAPNPAMYYVEYISPRFSFDLAGWLVILFWALLIITLFMAIMALIKHLYHKRKTRI